MQFFFVDTYSCKCNCHTDSEYHTCGNPLNNLVGVIGDSVTANECD